MVLGEQSVEVLGVHVESSIMGYGSCCYYGYCTCKWRSKCLATWFFVYVSLMFHCSEGCFLVCRESPLTGKILSVSLPCLSSTRRSVLSRKTMLETLQLRSWLVLLLKPRYQRWILYLVGLVHLCFCGDI